MMCKPLYSLLLCCIVILSSCGLQNNFLKQKYTDFGHHKKVHHSYSDLKAKNAIPEVPGFADTTIDDSLISEIQFENGKPVDSVTPIPKKMAENTLKSSSDSSLPSLGTNNFPPSEDSAVSPLYGPGMMGIVFALLVLLVGLFIISMLLGPGPALNSMMMVAGGIVVVVIVSMILAFVFGNSKTQNNKTTGKPSKEKTDDDDVPESISPEIAKNNILATGIISIILGALVVFLILLELPLLAILIATGITLLVLLLQRLWIYKYKDAFLRNGKRSGDHEARTNKINLIAIILALIVLIIAATAMSGRI